jgi:hypothetical protein
MEIQLGKTYLVNVYGHRSRVTALTYCGDKEYLLCRDCQTLEYRVIRRSMLTEDSDRPACKQTAKMAV